MKIQKKNVFLEGAGESGGGGGGGGGGRRRVLGQGGCERRSKVFVKIPKKKNLGGGGVGRGGSGGGRGSDQGLEWGR